MPKVFFLTLLIAASLLHNTLHICAASTSRVIEQYKNALKLTPEDTKLRYLLGRSLVQHGEYTAGIEEFLKVYTERREDPEINYNLGFAYLQAADYAKAEHYFNILLNIDAGAAKEYRLDNAFLNLGSRYREAGELEKAINSFTLSLRVDEGNIKTYLMLALLYSNNGDNARALEYLEKAREIDDKDEELIRFMTSIHNRIGSDYLARKMNPEARGEFEKVLAIDSSDLYAIYYLGYLDYLVKDMESAATRLGKLTSLKIDDDNLRQGIKPLLFNIGAYYLQNEKYDEAARSLEGVVKLFPDYSKAYYYLGLSAINMENYDRAIEVLEKTVELEPENAKAIKQLGNAYDRAREQHFQKGKRYYEAKKYREALSELDRTIMISPDFAPAKKYRDAVVAAFEAIRKEEEEKLGATTSALIKEGKALLEDGELIAAREKLLKVREIDPLNGDADAVLKLCLDKIAAEIKQNLHYGRTKMGEGTYYAAIKAFRRVLYFEPGRTEASEGIRMASQKLASQVEALNRDAENSMSSESFRRAYEIYSKVLEINPEEESALAGRQLSLAKLDMYYDEYLGMGRDYKKLEQYSEALLYFKKALNLKPGDSVALSEIGNVRQKMGSLKGIEEMLKGAKMAFKKGRLNEAISGFSNVLKLDNDNKDAGNGLREARAALRKRVDSMLSKASSLYNERNYKDVVALCRKILELDGEEKEAVKLLANARKAIKSETNPLVAEGKKLFDAGSVDAAVILFKRALRSDPGNPVAQRYMSKIDSEHVTKVLGKEVKRFYLMGIDRYTKGMYEEALNAWNNVLELDPEHEKALLNIGKAKRKIAAIEGG